MRHQDDGLAGAIEVVEQVKDLLAAVRIECAGRLVGQQQGGTIDEGAGDGHALALAAA